MTMMKRLSIDAVFVNLEAQKHFLRIFFPQHYD